MSRNLLQTYTDDTKVDAPPRSFAEGDAADVEPFDPRLEQTLPGDMGDDDDNEDAETMMLSRLPWPEPPRSLAERRALTKTDDGLARSIISPRNDPRALYWRLLGGAVILMACASVFLPRSSAQSTAPATNSMAIPTVAAKAQPAPLPPLIITVGTPRPTSDTSASKTTIDTQSLPVPARAPVAAPPAPKRASPPAPRARPASPSPLPKSKATRKNEVMIDDGF
jgi:hypothetical protein